ncbi:hypothetical protein BT96DRAFT_993761 [Gymnopus androsaceus JB14]|uniref:Uncharacterized protein n=1 Tax=Gymnopus androsaceus JB14 TaxID=1447944 RepID=A0A6A4HPP6_9AGAR|nr:hypothetical protein BT96DRAFT_993761 [Gymnopus androsaceus JB14]
MCQLVADASTHLHEALSKKVTLEKAACSNYFMEVYSQGVTVLCHVKDTYPNLEGLKDKKKLGTLLGNYHSISLSEAQAIAEEVAAASQSNAIIVDDKVALLVLALASMDVNNEVEAGTASNTQSAETSKSCSSPKIDIEDDSPVHSLSEASDEGPSICSGSCFIINFTQEPDYQYLLTLPSGEVPPPYVTTPGATPSPGTCMLILDIVERAQRENPLAIDLLKSIASKSVTKLSGLPIPALHAMMNFHHVKYLHNIKLAHLYAQCAEASHSICDQALANLTMKLSIEIEHTNPPISKSTSQVSGNVEMSSLDPPEPPLA